MGDEALIRRESLRRVMKDRKLAISDLERMVGGRYTYWRDLIAEGSAKSFGEKVARKIEEKLDPPLPRGYLDGAVSRRAPNPRADAGPPAPPPRDFADSDKPTESEWQILRDLRAIHDEDRALFAEELHKIADKYRSVTEVALGRFKSKVKS